MIWQQTRIAPETSHHVLKDQPLYTARFDEVLSFHEPGLAAVRVGDKAWHITSAGLPAYAQRFDRTFGYYEGRAAVVQGNDWWHILPNGRDLYPERYHWAGNFQGGFCTVRNGDGAYFHVDDHGRPAYQERWRYAGDFKDGLAVVQSDAGLSTHIKTDGTELHSRWFLDLDVFHKGYARARDASGWTHIDRIGCPCYARRFAMVEPFYNGQARVETINGALEVIDEAGATIQQLRTAQKSPLQRLSSIMVGYWGTQVVRTAVDLHIIDHLPGTTADVAIRAALPLDSTQRLLRGIWELGLVDRNGQQWLPTDTGELMRRDSPSGMAAAALHWGTEHYRAWAELTSSLSTGEPGFEKVFGQPFFNWLSANPEQLQRYHLAMRGYAEHDYICLPSFLPLEGVRHIIDAGGSSGTLISHILARRPDIIGTLLDLPEVIASASSKSLTERDVRLVEADLFSPWPCSADLVVLARVLHDWDDEKARTILRHARQALEWNGRVALVEFILSEETPAGALLDLNMLAICGARERTIEEWSSLAKSAGFDISNVKPLPTYGSVLILTPNGDKHE